MNITKEGRLEAVPTVSAGELAAINAFTRRELTAEEVYVFAVRLCDNEVDRDYERFATGALTELGRLFVGKTGISDHNWSAAGQKARVFRTQVERDPRKTTRAGEQYAGLKAWAYMLRREENEALIAEIEGGIKREVSIGCAMGECRCSICGADMTRGDCGHEKGQEYEGKLCHGVLDLPRDAYEWSFVAVPAQREAGVVKKTAAGETAGLAELAEKAGGAALGEWRETKRLAELGRTYLKELRREVVRLGALAQCGLEPGFLAQVAQRLEEEDLRAFKTAFARRVDGLYPPPCQLGTGERRTAPPPEEYKI